MSFFELFSDSAKKQKMLDRIFAGREPLDDRRFWEQYFKQAGISPETVAKIRHILEEQLGADLSRIRDTDDFSNEMAFVWDFDSLADVSIVQAFEKEFHSVISDAKAAKCRS